MLDCNSAIVAVEVAYAVHLFSKLLQNSKYYVQKNVHSVTEVVYAIAIKPQKLKLNLLIGRSEQRQAGRPKWSDVFIIYPAISTNDHNKW